jgi:ATP adenylyltransferase
MRNVEQKGTRRILWAPWRMAYIKQNRRQKCVFCCANEESEDTENLILCRGGSVFVMMNRFPYAYGHLLVSPLRHVKDMDGLTAQEFNELMPMTRNAIRVLTRCLSPEGFNVGINLGKVSGAGYADHLHVHIVPRWSGDHNFMPVLADTQIISEHLADTYRKLRAGFDTLAMEPSP